MTGGLEKNDIYIYIYFRVRLEMEDMLSSFKSGIF